MRFLLKITTLVAIITLLVWCVGIAWFHTEMLRHALYSSEYEHSDTPADVIVALTGGSDRMKNAIELLRNNAGEQLFVSGAGEGVTVDDLLKHHGYARPVRVALRPRIILGFEAQDTVGNAREVANWLKEHAAVQHIILVTSHYHMPRSLLEFTAALPQTRITPYAIISDNVKLEKWWSYPGSRRLIISEYHKYLAAQLMLWLHLDRTIVEII